MNGKALNVEYSGFVHGVSPFVVLIFAKRKYIEICEANYIECEAYIEFCNAKYIECEAHKVMSLTESNVMNLALPKVMNLLRKCYDMIANN